MNISNIIISQSTNQIWPSEIPRSTNYSVSTSPDPPLHVFYSIFFYASRGSGHETSAVVAVFPYCNLVLERAVSLPLSLLPIESSHQTHPHCYDYCRLTTASGACFGSTGRRGLYIYYQGSTNVLFCYQS